MTRWRTRWLVKRAGAPIVSFVLVIAIAMVAAVWSPVRGGGIGWYSQPQHERGFPGALRKYVAGGHDMNHFTGFGFSLHDLEFRPSAYETPLGPPVPLGPPLGLVQVPKRPKDYGVVVCRAGFPFRCLYWKIDYRYDAAAASLLTRGIETQRALPSFGKFTRRIPLMPEPIGLVLNVLIVSGLFVLPRWVWRHSVALKRYRKGLCLACSYPLGDFSVCPECGNPNAGVEVHPLVTRRRAKWIMTLLALLLCTVFLASSKYRVANGYRGLDTGGHINLSHGSIWFGWWRDSGFRRGYWHPDRFYHDWTFEPGISWKPRWEWTSAPSTGPWNSGYIRVSGSLPLWIPILLLAVPTAYLWRTDRRAKAGRVGC